MQGTMITGEAAAPMYCFLDTNVLLHCMTFDEVNWPEIVEASDVCLVIAPIVMTELDRHRNEEKNDWVQERARMLLGKLRSYFRDPQRVRGEPLAVRPHVLLIFVAHEPQVDWAALGLDPGWNDDRLLATIHQFHQEHSHAQVCLVARDHALQVKAANRGIMLANEEQIPEIARTSPLARELEQVQRELYELKNRAPKLVFGLWEGGELAPFVTRPRQSSRVATWGAEGAESVELSDEKIAARLTAEQNAVNAAYAAGQSAVTIGEITAPEVETFHQQAETYLQRLKLALTMQRSLEYGPFMQLQFCLMNDGSAPATDVDLKIVFPAGSFIVAAADVHDDLWGTVLLPQAPTANWMRLRRPNDSQISALNALSTLNIAPIRLSKLPPVPPPSGPRGPLFALEDDRRYVWFEHTKLPHNSRWPMPPVIAYVPPTVHGGYAIEWTMRADELVKPLTGTVQVRLAET